jgi:protein TonB
MRTTVIFILVLFSIFLQAKDTKKITTFNPYENFNEIYYVLKSDNSIKHGIYKAEKYGRILIKGHFSMGVMDSIWTQYDLSGVIRSKGRIKNTKRDSIWEFFDLKGKLEQKIDFSTNEVLLYRTNLAQNPFRIVSGGDTIMSILDRPPLFIGGMSSLNDFLANAIRMPLHKPNEKISGHVIVAFTIDSAGNTSNHRVLKGIGRPCNNEALRVVETLPKEWIPGELNGKKVSVDYILPIPFDSTFREMDPIDVNSQVPVSRNRNTNKTPSNHVNPPVGGWVLVSPIFDPILP